MAGMQDEKYSAGDLDGDGTRYPRVEGHRSVIPQQPELPRRHGDAEPLRRRNIARVHVGLVERLAIHRDATASITAGHTITRQTDDPPDDIAGAYERLLL